jgi:hypothetical protein
MIDQRNECGGRRLDRTLDRGLLQSLEMTEAAQRRQRYCSSSSCVDQTVQEMRWSIGRFSSPRQYAPATDSSLNGPILPVDSTCGPRHRSTNRPCSYVDTSDGGSPWASAAVRRSSRISTLYGWSRSTKKRRPRRGRARGARRGDPLRPTRPCAARSTPGPPASAPAAARSRSRSRLRWPARCPAAWRGRGPSPLRP